MNIYETYEAARNELMYQTGGFKGSFLWQTRGGFVKACTVTAGVVAFFVPKRAGE